MTNLDILNYARLVLGKVLLVNIDNWYAGKVCLARGCHGQKLF